MCTEEDKADKCEQHAELRRVQACHVGPTPSIDDDLYNIPNTMSEGDDNDGPVDEEDYPLEEGDRIFVVHFWDEPEEICASQNVSSRLAEAFYKNSAPATFRNSVLDYLHKFKEVFSKQSFNALPERKLWDHAIELTPDVENKLCKVYPLSIVEQQELDRFLEENLTSGRIRPSKSPMASPFFFIKKKD